MSAIVAAYGPYEESGVQRMLDRLAHRGPDGVQIEHTGANVPILLGAHYLSITDPVEGTQPVAGATSGTWMVGDGKIYNYRRIRKQLGDERFRTKTDLEYALLLYVDQGVAASKSWCSSFAL